jgi:hypothetical protein
MAPGWGKGRLRIKLKNCNVWRALIIESQATKPPKCKITDPSRSSHDFELLPNDSIKIKISASTEIIAICHR